MDGEAGGRVRDRGKQKATAVPLNLSDTLESGGHGTEPSLSLLSPFSSLFPLFHPLSFVLKVRVTMRNNHKGACTNDYEAAFHGQG